MPAPMSDAEGAERPDPAATPSSATDFIRQRVEADRASGKHGGRVVTRFPPEPNGYLHLGHAKSITINFGIARDYGGECFLRFDDTNPAAEEARFIDAIQEDVRWLGYDFEGRLRFASDYYPVFYAAAEQLVRQGDAYVDSSTSEQMRERRGKPGEPGIDSPHRTRSVDENLELLRKMRAGEIAEGTHVLRAKIDMASPNFNLRDPSLYRVRKLAHPRTGDAWCIYPMYDFAHPLSDAIEGTTHSICTLEFEDHRPLYDWVLDKLADFLRDHAKSRPEQIEFAKLAVDYTITSKRKLKELVAEGHVAGWDDPRMPTLAGLRRRGVPPAALRSFCERVGVSKNEGIVELGLLEHCIREELDSSTRRAMCVLRPLKITLVDWPEGETRAISAPYHPADEAMGARTVVLEREIFIEDTDFMRDPPKKFFRLGPGREVRLRWGPIVKCEEIIEDAEGHVVELRCTHDPASLTAGGGERKVKGTIHWVGASHAIPLEVRLYDRLFAVATPTAEDDVDYKTHLNPSSLERVTTALGEASLATSTVGDRFQFERTGYFTVDPDSSDDRRVFNRTVALRDGWAKTSKT